MICQGHQELSRDQACNTSALMHHLTDCWECCCAATVPQTLHANLVNTRAVQQLASQLPHVDLAALDPDLRQAAFVESADLFAAMVPKPEARAKLLLAMAALWGVPPADAAERYERLARPALQEGEAEVVVGRVLLPRLEQDPLALASRRQGGGKEAGGAGGAGGGGGGGGLGGTFSATGHAMRMMERVAASLSRNEPLLLVGETGERRGG